MINVNGLSFLVRKSVQKQAKVHNAHKSAQKHMKVRKSVQKCAKARNSMQKCAKPCKST